MTTEEFEVWEKWVCRDAAAVADLDGLGFEDRYRVIVDCAARLVALEDADAPVLLIGMAKRNLRAALRGKVRS